jgi:uncharacterized protein DUF2378
MLRYVASLPGGLASYPTCVQKASVLRQFLELGPKSWGSNLPAPLDALVCDTPPLTAWIPEVHATALYLALIDARRWEEKDFVAQSLTMNRELLQGPLYRILMSLASPGRLLREASNRWSAMHQGTELSAQMVGNTSAQVNLAFPRRLVPTLIAHCYATAFQAALERASAKSATTSLVVLSDEKAVYRCDWK